MAEIVLDGKSYNVAAIARGVITFIVAYTIAEMIVELVADVRAIRHEMTHAAIALEHIATQVTKDYYVA